MYVNEPTIQGDIMWLIPLSCDLRVCDEVADDDDDYGVAQNTGGVNNFINTTPAEW